MWQDNYNYYLYHHGILGQRWGKKNGPPYPLGSSDHSASEKKAGWRKSLDKPNGSSHTRNSKVSKNTDNSEKEGFHLTDKQKKALKIGAAAVAATLAAYGTYKLTQSGKLNDLAAIGKAKVDAMLGKKAGSAGDDIFEIHEKVKSTDKLFISDRIRAVSGETGLKLKTKTFSMEEDLKVVNLGYNRNKPEWKNNCSHASIAYLLRRMGLDIKAKPMKFDEEGGLMFAEATSYFKGAKRSSIELAKSSSSDGYKRELSNKILSLCKNESKGMGIIALRRIDSSGHFFTWENQRGKIVFTNPQIGGINADQYFNDIVVGKVKNVFDVARLDNLEINIRKIHEVVENI